MSDAMVHPSRRRKFVETNDDELSAGQNTLPKRRYTPANLPDFRKVVEEDPSTRRNGRRSRWASRSKSHVPGLPTALPANLAPEQLQSYVLHMRLEEINRKLRLDDVVPSVERRQRSPSPEPVYGSDGKRVNTKEFRYRQVLEAERAKLVDLGQNTIPGFKLQGDFKRGPTKMTEKIFIPDREHPHINFMGLLIGPRGNTLKKMEAETGAKISIRGRGSIKEGKQRGESDNMDLHALISGDSEEKVRKAVKVIENIIDQAVSVPEGQLELKRNQLRELAALNGTLRDDEAQICQNCGAFGHRRYDCPEAKNATATIICRICGGSGHIAKDCQDRNNPEALQAAQKREQVLNSEYESFMNQLGGGGPTSSATTGGGSYSSSMPPPLPPSDSSAPLPASSFQPPLPPSEPSRYGSNNSHQNQYQPQQQYQPQHQYQPAPPSGYNGYPSRGYASSGYGAPPGFGNPPLPPGMSPSGYPGAPGAPHGMDRPPGIDDDAPPGFSNAPPLPPGMIPPPPPSSTFNQYNGSR